MTLSQYMHSQFSNAQSMDFIIRMLVACACGAIIGAERGSRLKEAGARTHILVCCAAALFMIISKYGFADLLLPDGSLFDGTRGADPARIAAQVVSGISFLGVGVIYKNSGVVKGLTTAAGIWATAAVGLAIGSGMFLVGISATVIVSVLQGVMHHFAIGMDAYATNQLQFTVRNGYEFNSSLSAQLEEWKAQVTESKVTRRRDGTTDYDLVIRRRRELTYQEMKSFIEAHEEIISGSNNLIR